LDIPLGALGVNRKSLLGHGWNLLQIAALATTMRAMGKNKGTTRLPKIQAGEK